MQSSTGKIFIRCLEVDAKYVLQFEGVGDWSESFPSIEAAIRRAGQLVVEETKVIAYDVAGQGVVVTTLFPLEAPLRDHPQWAERVLERSPDAVGELKNALATKGLRGALRFLNSLTPHRFTSVYHFDGPTLHGVTFYDRQNPEDEGCEDIPVEASYCVFVRDRAENFIMPDASNDELAKDHPKREVVKRYCGIPLLDSAGKMFGSICHFDLEPGRITDRDVELLERMADLLRRSVEMLRVAHS